MKQAVFERLAALGGVFAALWAAHLLGDHVVQTDAQAKGKTAPRMLRYWAPDDRWFTGPSFPGWLRPMAGHLGGYHATQLVALGAVAGATGWRPQAGRVVAGVAFSALTHGVLDRREPVRRLLLATRSPAFADPHIELDIPVVEETPHGVRSAALRVRPSAAGALLAVEGDTGAVLARGVDRRLVARVRGALPLQGMYLADQSCHAVALLGAALIMVGGRD